MAKNKKTKKSEAENLACPKVQLLKLADIRPAEYNPRVINTDQLEGLANSIREFGCIELIVVNVHKNKNTIISGHQRHKILTASNPMLEHRERITPAFLEN